MNALILIVLFLPCYLIASGGGAGNGGDGIACDFRKTIVIDYYEATMPNREDNAFTSLNNYRNSSEKQVITDFVQYLKRHIQTSQNTNLDGLDRTSLRKFYNRVKSFQAKFKSTDSWEHVPELSDIKDSNHQYLLPRGCQLVQLAKNLNGKITVSDKFFNQLTKEQKNMLYLHEFIYSIGLKYYSHSNSFMTRYLTRSLLRANLNSTGKLFDLDFLIGIKNFIHNKQKKEFSPAISLKIDYPFATSFTDFNGSFYSKETGCTDRIDLESDVLEGMYLKIKTPQKTIHIKEGAYLSTLKLQGHLFYSNYKDDLIDGQHIISTPIGSIGFNKDGDFFIISNQNKMCIYDRIY